MSKRPYDHSLSAYSDNAHRLAIHDLLSPNEQPDSPDPPKRPRNFIASVVCLFPDGSTLQALTIRPARHVV